ncbi:hypothetical protein VB836_13325, partial [Limnoraphis robusta BA-68 BA1]|uniref:hypothetical protein n=1 Tax=Limnoraphis robusta TaxID=1118279 RepID=UPI002B20F0FD
ARLPPFSDSSLMNFSMSYRLCPDGVLIVLILPSASHRLSVRRPPRVLAASLGLTNLAIPNYRRVWHCPALSSQFTIRGIAIAIFTLIFTRRRRSLSLQQPHL